MTRLDSISDKVMDLVGHVGDSIRDGMPTRAGTLLQTGAALGMAKTGTRAAGYFVRRHPAWLVATVVGAGAAWYAVHRYRKKQAAGQTIDGQARKVESRRTPARSASRTQGRAGNEADRKATYESAGSGE